jgi:hypothetical protein
MLIDSQRRQGVPCLYGDSGDCYIKEKNENIKNTGIGDGSDLKGIEIDVSNMKSLFEKWGFHTTVLLDSDSIWMII